MKLAFDQDFAFILIIVLKSVPLTTFLAEEHFTLDSGMGQDIVLIIDIDIHLFIRGVLDFEGLVIPFRRVRLGETNICKIFSVFHHYLAV